MQKISVKEKGWLNLRLKRKRGRRAVCVCLCVKRGKLEAEGLADNRGRGEGGLRRRTGGAVLRQTAGKES